MGRLDTGWRRIAALNAGALVAIGAAFRLVRLDSVPGLNADEYFSLEAMHALLAGDVSTYGFFVPTGRLIDFFYAVPAWALDALLPRSAASIRAPAVLSGLALTALSFPLLRKVRSPFVAGVVTVLVAVSPPLISYSRIGWEYSQVPLAALLIAASALARRTWPSVLALAAGVLVHPSLAYLAPMVALPALVKLRGSRRALGGVLLAVGASALVLWAAFQSLGPAIRQMLGEAPARLGDGAQAWAFLKLYANLFGASVARQNLTDAPELTFGPWHAAFLALSVGLVVAYLGSYFRRRRTEPRATADLALVGGFALGVAAFYATRGVASVTPPIERYGLFLVVPSLVVLTLMAEALATTTRQRALVLGAAFLSAWTLVVELKHGYFDYFELTGGANAHITYHSAAVEPKVAAVDWIQARTAEPVIYAKQWRTYWPVRFVARTTVKNMTRAMWNGDLSVEELRAFASGGEFLVTMARGGGYVLGFPDPGFERALGALLPGAQLRRQDFKDAGGVPVITVWYVDG